MCAEIPYPPVNDPFLECRTRVLASLGRLSALGSTEAVRSAAPRELAEACGFTRAMMSAVRGSRWVPLQLHTNDVLDPRAADFQEYVESDLEIPLANMLAETDIVRRGTALLIDENLVETRAFKPIIEVARSPAYVAAPILVERRTIGFMHADRVGQARQVNEDDRRCIQAFTAEMAVVYQCVALSERLGDRARRVLRELERAAEVLKQNVEMFLDAVCLSPYVSDPDATDGDPGCNALLTVREYEVLEHVASGATNRVIAQQLSVSDDTVKSHMRSVLRKLRVTNRGAAVAQYLKMRGGNL